MRATGDLKVGQADRLGEGRPLGEVPLSVGESRRPPLHDPERPTPQLRLDRAHPLAAALTHGKRQSRWWSRMRRGSGSGEQRLAGDFGERLWCLVVTESLAEDGSRIEALLSNGS